MDPFKRVCMVAPDRWAASLALALRQKFTRTEVVCVGDARTNELCLKLGIATAATTELADGLTGSHLVLVGQRDAEPDMTVRNVLHSCEPDATICGHGRSVTVMSELARDLDRDDVHYVSIRIQCSWDPASDVALASASDVKGHVLNLTPAAMDDLDAMSGIQQYLQATGAKVVMLSPRAHDRQRAEDVYLPKLILLPLVDYLADSTEGKERGMTSEKLQIIESFSGLSEQTAAVWAKDLMQSKEYLLSALDAYQNHLLTLKQGLATGQVEQQIVASASAIAKLSAEAKAKTPEVMSEMAMQSPENLSPEALAQMVDSLLVAVDRIETGNQAGSSTDIRAVQQLLEKTHLVLAHLTQANPVAQTVEAAARAVESPVVAEVKELEAVSNVIQEQVEITPDRTIDSGAIDNAEIHVDEPAWDASAETPQEPASPPFENFYYQDNLITLDVSPDSIPEEPVAEVPAVEHSAADDSLPTQSENWDIRVHDRPELQVMQRMSRLLASARIVLRNVERNVSPEGINILCISLANPSQTERACELLRRAGMTLE